MRSSKFKVQRPISAGALALLSLCAFVRADGPTGIPPHPEKLVYPKLDFKLPKPSEVRTTLSNGMVVYIAEDRMLFARGALVAARWGRGKKPGIYSMADVLGLTDF